MRRRHRGLDFIENVPNPPSITPEQAKTIFDPLPPVPCDYLIGRYDPGFPARQHWFVNDREIDEAELHLIRQRCRLFDMTTISSPTNERQYLVYPEA